MYTFIYKILDERIKNLSLYSLGLAQCLVGSLKKYSHAPLKKEHGLRMMRFIESKELVNIIVDIIKDHKLDLFDKTDHISNYDTVGYYYCIDLLVLYVINKKDGYEKIIEILEHEIKTENEFYKKIIERGGEYRYEMLNIFEFYENESNIIDKLKLMLHKRGIYDFSLIQSDNNFKCYIINKDIIKRIINSRKYYKINISSKEVFYLFIDNNIELSDCLPLINEYLKWILGEFRQNLIYIYNRHMNKAPVNLIWYKSLILYSVSIEIDKNFIINAEISYDEGTYDIDSLDEGLLNVKIKETQIYSMYYDI
jgi:hypothetical protein